MIRLLHNLKWMAVIAIASVFTGCTDKADDRPEIIIDPVDPVILTQGAGSYFGYSKQEFCDHFVLYLHDSETHVDESGLSGDGVGLCFDIYAPARAIANLSSGTYEARKPLQMSYLHTFELEKSYLFISGEKVGIAAGSLEISVTGNKYTIQGKVTDVDGMEMPFLFGGEIPVDDQSFGPYTRAVSAEAFYFRDMMNPEYDNWSFSLCGEGVQMTPNMAFEGEGMGFGFDIYTPLSGNPVFPTSTYLPANGEDGGNLEYKFIPGQDYGSGMLTGSYVWIKAPGASEVTYVYIVGGQLNVEKSGDIYTILAEIVGDDGADYNLKFIGKIAVYDPFAGM